jgi:hypothetical protein
MVTDNMRYNYLLLHTIGALVVPLTYIHRELRTGAKVLAQMSGLIVSLL